MRKLSKLLVLSLSLVLVSCGEIDPNKNNNVNKTLDGIGVASIKKVETNGNEDTYEIEYVDGSKSYFLVINGENGEQGIQGEPGKDGHTPEVKIGENGNWIIDGVDTEISAKGVQGETGNGIEKIELTDTKENVDTYTIFFTDGTTTTFTVTNGVDGEQGIQGEPGKDGHTPTIEIGENGNRIIDGVDSEIKAEGKDGLDGNTILNGTNNPTNDLGKDGDFYINTSNWDVFLKENGEWISKGCLKGYTGVGIKTIEKTCSEENVDIYTITYSDGTTTNFSVTNGADGEQGIQGEPGEDGHTPIIEIGENGHWIIDKVDMGISAIGKDGEDGKSAYELYLEENPEYTGTLSDWIDDLVSGKLYKTFRVEFDCNGGYLDMDIPYNYEAGSVILQLPVPKHSKDRTFLGWYTGSTINDKKVSNYDPIYSDITLVARWDKYDVTFKNEFGYSRTVIVESGDTIDGGLYIPSRPDKNGIHYRFVGWDFDFNTSIFRNYSIYPVWQEFDGNIFMNFGSYPQTYVNDEATINNLKTLENANDNRAILEYDENGDGVKEKFMALETDREVKSISNGDIIKPGINYFRFEPISWMILSDNNGEKKLFSEHVLDASPFEAEGYDYFDVENGINVRRYDDYSKSDIREFVTNNFYNIAFSESEKSQILTTFVDNSEAVYGYEEVKYTCEDTYDKVYLISYIESRSDFIYDYGLKGAKATDFSACLNIADFSYNASDYGTVSYRTRNGGLYSGESAYRIYGTSGAGVLCTTNIGIRPAINISL